MTISHTKFPWETTKTIIWALRSRWEDHKTTMRELRSRWEAPKTTTWEWESKLEPPKMTIWELRFQLDFPSNLFMRTLSKCLTMTMAHPLLTLSQATKRAKSLTIYCLNNNSNSLNSSIQVTMSSKVPSFINLKSTLMQLISPHLSLFKLLSQLELLQSTFRF